METEWLGEIVISANDNTGMKTQVSLEGKEIGLREDGVVVWRVKS